MNNDFGYNQEELEGLDGQINPLSLGMEDEEIAAAIGNRITDGKTFWNDKYQLDTVRQRNYQYWLADFYRDQKLHKHNVPYSDPVSTIAIETLIPMVLANPPQPVVANASDTDASKELAANLQDVLLSKYEDLFIKSKLMTSTRHVLQGQRIGVLKLSWDNSIGELQEDGTRSGDIKVEAIHPKYITIDANATDKQDIPMIAHLQNKSLEEWGMQFPKKRQQLIQATGMSSGVAVKMSQLMGIHEVQFTDYKNGKRTEAIAWKMDNHIFGSMKNPFWNYDEVGTDNEGNSVSLNYFAKPKKTYVFINHLNSGEWVIDDNSLMDLAINQQDIINKRGKQLVENADAAGSGLVYNTKMIKPSEMAKLVGNPTEKIGVDGDVRAAVARVAPPLLPYVPEERIDGRNRVNDIFGSNAPIRGDDTNSPTLGQEVLSQRSDLSRTRVLATSIEDACDSLYKYMTQIMKVFYDSPREIQYTGTEGQTSFIPFSSESIEPGVMVKVKSGSLLPDDPVTKAQQAVQLANVLDPLTLMEMVGVQNPKEVAKRIYYAKALPDRYLTEVLQVSEDENQADPDAVQEHEQLMQGVEVPPQTEPSKAHLATHQMLIEQGQVNDQVTIHVEAEIANAKKSLGQQEETPQDQPEEGGQGGGLLSRLLGRGGDTQ